LKFLRSFLEVFGSDYLHQGYNIIGYDIDFLLNRYTPSDCSLSKALTRVNNVKFSFFTPGGAVGAGAKKFPTSPGLVIMDVMLETLRSPKRLRSYKLNNVANVYLGFSKEDMHYTQIPVHWKGDLFTRGELLVYCVKDALLPQQLIDTMLMINNMAEMCRISRITAQGYLDRGTGIRVLGCVMWFLKQDNLVIRTIPDHLKPPPTNKKKRVKGYQGATVIDPKVGYYVDYVPTLDFASLYPSIMIGYNTCFTTKIVPDRLHLFHPDMYEISPIGKVFLKSSVKQGMLPKILDIVLAKRRAANAALAKATDPKIKTCYNCKQLALKITANSVYGFTGNPRSKIPDPDIAATVTAYGRQLIEISRAYVLEHYPGTDVLYGDSVTGETPLVIRDSVTRRVRILSIEDYFGQHECDAHPYPGFKALDDNGRKDKQRVDVTNNDQIWTETGWVNIKRVIKHKCDKQIYRVRTKNGIVDVTKDHSLLRDTGEQVKPTEIGKGNRLLASFPDVFDVTCDKLDPDETWVWGLFMADGQCDQSMWSIEGSGRMLLQTAKLILERIEPLKFKIVGDMLTPDGDSEYLVAKYRALFWSGGSKTVPNAVLNSPMEVRERFVNAYYLRGHYYDALTAQTLYYLCKSIGFNDMDVYKHNSEPDKYRVHPGKPAKTRNGVLSVTRMPPVNDVYDIETESGHFAAGIGELILKNTDSIMVKLPGHLAPSMQAALDLGHVMAEAITKFINRVPIKLTFEKIYHPYLLQKKKRYAGQHWTKSEKANYIDAKGIETVRRDWSLHTAETLNRCLEVLMREQDIEKALKIARDAIAMVRQRKVKLEDLAVTREYSRHHSTYTTETVHVNAIKREIERRGESNAPQLKDRVCILITKGRPGKKSKTTEKSELMEHVIENNAEIDWEYYVKDQLVKPLSSLFAPIFGGSRDKAKDKLLGQKTLHDFFPKVQK
jgi:DNA polymerase elongation subunit (family B)